MKNAKAVDTENISIIDGKPILRGPASSSSAGLKFDTWTQINADYPVFLILQLYLETDGTYPGAVYVEVDESGGTNLDYKFTQIADASLGNGGGVRDVLTLYLPTGATVRVYNFYDPNNNNNIEVDRVFVIAE